MAYTKLGSESCHHTSSEPILKRLRHQLRLRCSNTHLFIITKSYPHPQWQWGGESSRRFLAKRNPSSAIGLSKSRPSTTIGQSIPTCNRPIHPYMQWANPSLDGNWTTRHVHWLTAVTIHFQLWSPTNTTLSKSAPVTYVTRTPTLAKKCYNWLAAFRGSVSYINTHLEIKGKVYWERVWICGDRRLHINACINP